MLRVIIGIALTLLFTSVVFSQKKIRTFNRIQQVSGNIKAEDQLQRIESEIGFSLGTNPHLLSINNDKLGITHHKYRQNYKGIPIYGASFTIHTSENNTLLSGILFDIDDLETTAQLTTKEVNALVKRKYPGGDIINKSSELTIYIPQEEKSGPTLCYKIDIISASPLYSKTIFIDAIQGKVMGEEEKLMCSDHTLDATTIYDGKVQMNVTTNSEGSHELLSSHPLVETRDLQGLTDYSQSVAVADESGLFDVDPIAAQAHWGSIQALQYFADHHQRNSYDDEGHKVKSYVHYSTGFRNAFWDGLQLVFGDGDASIKPLVSVDVVAHEYTHAVTQHTAGLRYKYESGAINESISDIFGELIEYYAKNTIDWLVGSELFESKEKALRSLKEPNRFSQPDTYMGDYFYQGTNNNGGVHINSGVHNKWFYLLANGGIGVNDHGDQYEVHGIGLEKSAHIIYRNLSYYLHTFSTFQTAREGSIQSAIDIYGENSPEMKAVMNAWYAIGVGPGYQDNPCYSSPVKVRITTDNYPEETSWSITDPLGKIVAQDSNFTLKATTSSKEINLPDGNYTFLIEDLYGDGICCNYGKGEYQLIINDQIIARGSTFAAQEQISFCISETSDPAPSDTIPPLLTGNLEIKDITSHSAHISWLIAHDSDSIIDYELALSGQILAITSNNEWTLDNLVSNYLYEVTLRAVDQSGNQSIPIYGAFTTLTEKTKLDLIKDLQITDITHDRATLTFEKGDNHPAETVYNIIINGQIYTNIQNTNQTILTNLNENTSYSVEVWAENTDYHPSSRSEISFITPPQPDTEAPSIPTNLVIDRITSDAAYVQWSPSYDEVGVSGYRLQVDNKTYLIEDGTEKLLTDLTPETYYELKLSAYDEANNHSEAVISGFITLPEIIIDESTTLLASYFEDGWDSWLDGGNDCNRYKGNRSYEGNYSIRLRDDFSEKSSMTSPDLEIDGFASLEIDFYFYAYSMEINDAFIISIEGKEGWEEIKRYVSGIDFNNRNFYHVSIQVPIDYYTALPTIRLRISADANTNGDLVYIDAVQVIGHRQFLHNLTGVNHTLQKITKSNEISNVNTSDVTFFPNPVNDKLYLESHEPVDLIKIFTLSGQLLREISLKNIEQIDLSTYPSGQYLIFYRAGKLYKSDIIIKE